MSYLLLKNGNSLGYRWKCRQIVESNNCEDTSAPVAHCKCIL